ncbi:MAG: PTPA-CTERM sorting domain-containing protein [Hyphomicrobiaceae bacterium]
MLPGLCGVGSAAARRRGDRYRG